MRTNNNRRAQRVPKQKQNRNNKQWTVVLLAAVALVLLSLGGGLLAKYIQTDTRKNNQVTSPPFYFTVDVMGNTNDASDLNRTIELYGGGVQEFSFSVQNFFDATRVNGEEIVYTIESVCDTQGYAYTLTDKGSDTLTSPGSLSGGTADQNAYTLYMPGSYSDPISITVTVKSSAPYVKELVLNFVLNPYESEVLYRLVDSQQSPYAELIIMSNVPLNKQQLKVDWSAINGETNLFQVDTMNEYVADVDGGSVALTTNNPANQGGFLKSFEITQEIRAKESVSVFFFKTNSSLDYSTEKINTPENKKEYKNLHATKVTDGNGNLIHYLVTLTPPVATP